MAIDRTAFIAVPAAAALLLWPALWNGYPIVFADTGTYLSQAIHRYAGWDRPVFYSLFMLPLHATITLWPVITAQALLAAWTLWRVFRALLPRAPWLAFVGGTAVASICTWLPWIVCELTPDVFTPLLVLEVCLLAWVPELLSRGERVTLVGLAAFMIASQQSSLPLGCVLLGILGVLGRCRFPEISRLAAVSPPLARPGASESPIPEGAATRSPDTMPPDTTRHDRTRHDGTRQDGKVRRWPLIVFPPALALLGLCAVNLAAHGRFAISPFGNIFLLARVIYDGPGMAVLRRDCPAAGWRLCPFLDGFPPTSDDFLWAEDSPLRRAGGPKAVSQDADAIIRAALTANPAGETRAALSNTMEQISQFASGDGLNPWPAQVSPWIERDFPAWEAASYASARQQAGSLTVPPLLSDLHLAAALAGVVLCALLLPIAFARRSACAGFLLAVLVSLPVSAAITGSLSAPHDRYQSRIMWLPPFVAVVSLASLRRRSA